MNENRDKKGHHKQKESHQLFFQLYGRCQNRLFGFLYIMDHNEKDAEDLLQDTASALWENFDRYEPETNFAAWAMTIAKHKAINFLKQNFRSRSHLSEDIYDRLVAIEMQRDDIAERSEALKHCLQQLKEMDRKLLLMRYERDLSMAKIAEIFGRSSNGIYHTMARIHSVLSQCVQRVLARRPS